MTDLSTTYLGLELDHPIVASASPLTGSIDTLCQLEEAGAAAVVLPSLFEEQVEHEDEALDAGAELVGAHVEAHGSFLPDLPGYKSGADEYLDHLIQAKHELAIPVIASLNGNSDGGWTHYATSLQDEGADALELNIYDVAADVDVSGAEVEDRYLRLVSSVRAAVQIPVAVKVGPYFSSPGNFVRRLADAGADGVVLFNRFYQPDIDLASMSVAPDLVLSTPADMRLVLRWVALLWGRVDVDLAATTGVHDADGAIKLILAGADVTMMTAALLRHGPGHVATVLVELEQWFDAQGYQSLTQARGSMSQASVADPTAFERANYMKTLVSYRP